MERNTNICMYGKHEIVGDTEVKFSVTHCFHNQSEDLFDTDDLKKDFTGTVFEMPKYQYAP